MPLSFAPIRARDRRRAHSRQDRRVEGQRHVDGRQHTSQCSRGGGRWEICVRGRLRFVVSLEVLFEKRVSARSIHVVTLVSAGPPFGGLYLKPPSSGGCLA